MSCCFRLFHSVITAALISLPKPQSQTGVFLVSLQTWHHALDVLGEWTVPPLKISFLLLFLGVTGGFG